MHPIEDLTPKQIVAELDQFIIGQQSAKRAVAVALRNRYRRQQVSEEERNDILPKNILMIGPTGVGKTEIARRLAQISRAPFIKVEATKFTEVGYVGRDVDSMIRDLVQISARLVENERKQAHLADAKRRAIERVGDQILQDRLSQRGVTSSAMHEFGFAADYPVQTESSEPADDFDYEAEKAQLVAEIESGTHDNTEIEVEIEEPGSSFLQVFTPGGMEEMGLDMLNGLGGLGQNRREFRKFKVKDGLRILEDNEAKLMIDSGSVNREAVERVEQTGIIFIDEIDKVAIKTSGGSGPDVSREGVQRDLLPVIEGSTVQTKYGPVRTDHILFICAGAFHLAKPSDLIPELQGRLPIRVTLESLAEEDFCRILREPKNALIKQYQKLLSVDGVEVSFTGAALDEVAHFAVELNSKVENIGARRLHTLMERILEDLSFEAPDCGPKSVEFQVEDVRRVLKPLMDNATTDHHLL